jgi:NTE family protein
MNVPLAASGAAAGSRYRTGRNRPDDSGLMIALFFSGGGTRAAAFAYGVLRELSATPVPGGRRMLDEVTTINAVSGGSFTAAYFCLYGDRIFSDFEGKFLKYDVQGTLYRRFLSPLNATRLLSASYGRSDLAAEFYDEQLFHGATFGDLAKTNAPRPYLVINATNICTATPVQFTQSQFDLIGSDLSRFPIARAVAASSAVPLLFSPIILKNYADRVPAGNSLLLEPAGGADIFAGYRASLTETYRGYRDAAEHPYIFLMDGGLADNLSLRNLLDVVILSGGWDATLERMRRRGITKLAIIVVNAAVDPKMDWAHLDATPGFRSVIMAFSGSAINRNNKETVALVEGSLAQWQAQQAARRAGAEEPTKVYFVTVDFHSVQDPAEKAFFDGIPTNFELPPETVDRLVQAGGQILRAAPSYRTLLKDLETDQPVRADRPPVSGQP